MSENFGTVVVVDFEYEVDDGELPESSLCMVAHVLDENLQHVRTIRLWRGEFGRRPPFDIGPDTLFVAYSAWAEMTCFKVLGWQFPMHIFDLHTAYLAASNMLLPHDPDEERSKPRKRLSDACRAYGIEGWENIDKDDDRQGHRRGPLARSTAASGLRLLRRGRAHVGAAAARATARPRPELPPADVERVLHWSNYSAKAIALIQARGMPIDMALWNLVQENKAAVIGELLRQFDPSHGDDDPIYTPDGQWSYGRFERWLARTGVIAWPRLDSGAARHRRRRLPADVPRARHRGAARAARQHRLHRQGEAADRARRSQSAIAVSVRHRDRPQRAPQEPVQRARRHALVHGVPARRDRRLSRLAHAGGRRRGRPVRRRGADARLRRRRRLSRARAHVRAHRRPRSAALEEAPTPRMRQRMKALQLGDHLRHGRAVAGARARPSPADRQRDHRAAQAGLSAVLGMARRHGADRPCSTRRIESVFGWPLRLTTSPNQRTLYNFPMQAGGAEMLRLAAVRLCEAGIVPMHAGARRHPVRGDRRASRSSTPRRSCAQAGRDVCGGFEIGVDVDQKLIGGARYRDKRPMAQKMWATIMATLEAIGALPKGAAA